MTRLTALLLLLAVSASAQVTPDHEVEVVRSLYDNGKYAEALRRANDAMELSNFADAQRVNLHEVAALSAFNLSDSLTAKRHFLQLLLIEPDHQLDRFAVAPPAIKVFEQVRTENTDKLNVVRQQLVLRAEQARREAADRERLLKEQEERRRRIEDQARTVTVRTIEKRPFITNFVPFGGGQFQQGRLGWGAAFAIVEAVVGITSVIAYFAINALYEDVTQMLTGYRNPDGSSTITISVKQIRPERQNEFRVWSGIKYGTGIAFYAAYLAGVGDAIWHHQPEVVTETQQQVPSAPPKPTVQLNLFPTTGGLGAGLTIGF
jgi:hypothetical protein